MIIGGIRQVSKTWLMKEFGKLDFQMITEFKQTYIDALKHYYFADGMPEAVQSFAENKEILTRFVPFKNGFLSPMSRSFPSMPLMK